MGKILSKVEILNANDSKTIEVDVPEWGGSVLLRPMTGCDREAYESGLQSRFKGTGDDKKINHLKLRVEVLAMVMVDADGNKLFTKDDLERLNQKSASAIVRLFDIVVKENGLAENAAERAKGN